MKSEEPLISIIVPVYNVEKYLERCLDTLLNQTYSKLEIILVNDGSTDNSGAICDKYERKDKRIKVIHQLNKGLSGARNTGIKNVKGEYLGFVDSDDWVELNMFEIMLQTSIEKKVDVVECQLNKTDNKTDGTLLPIIKNAHIENRSDTLKRIIGNQSFSVWRRLYKTQLVKDIRFVEGKNSEDVYYTLEVLNRVNKIAFINNKLYNYFIGGVSITRGGYRLKTLDTVDAALHLAAIINKYETDEVLKANSNSFLLTILLYNYKLLNLNSNIDPEQEHRKRIKKLIVENFNNNYSNMQLTLAKIMPIPIFQLMLKLKNIFL